MEGHATYTLNCDTERVFKGVDPQARVSSQAQGGASSLPSSPLSPLPLPSPPPSSVRECVQLLSSPFAPLRLLNI